MLMCGCRLPIRRHSYWEKKIYFKKRVPIGTEDRNIPVRLFLSSLFVHPLRGKSATEHSSLVF